MKTGFLGAFVVSWSQTKIDGLEAAPIDSLNVGATWSWHGDVVRVDGPSGILRLDQADGDADIRKRAARSVRRLVGAVARNTSDVGSVMVNDPLMESCFVVTDGRYSYTVTLIETGQTTLPLLMFLDELPPRNVDLWIVHQSLDSRFRNLQDPDRNGVICFTPGTTIATPNGLVAVENLQEGDQVETRDNGAQDVLWIGSRRMTGARLFVMPHLRPIRFQTGALNLDMPDQDLLVSPRHRMLLRGPAVRDLFNTTEVLVAASDLVNGHSITIDRRVREITYIHLMLPSHQVLWANGVETESFHPANTALTSLNEPDRVRLLAQHPELEQDPYLYGDHARRNLSGSEAAILLHEAA